MKTVGIVLAGGLSRRFGSPKAFARIENMYFYERAVDALAPHCEQVVIVTLPTLKSSFITAAKVITDLPEVAGLGPLAGILSAMEYAKADRYIVLSCDMPYVDEGVIRKLVAFHEKSITAIVASGRHHPLVSVWDSVTKNELSTALRSKQLRVMTLQEKCGVTWIKANEFTDNEQRVFANVNTPTDLERG